MRMDFQRDSRETSPGFSQKRKRNSTDEPNPPSGTSRSRTLSNDGRSPRSEGEQTVDIPNKKSRLLDGRTDPGLHNPSKSSELGLILSDLPSTCLRLVFTFLDPFSLGCLLRVSRLFQQLLTPANGCTELFAANTRNSLTNPSDIWSMSRRTYSPAHPRPAGYMSELELMRLIYGNACQFCWKKPVITSTVTSTPWNSGPGPQSVRSIWAFGVRTCGPCLQSRIISEAGLLLSSSSVLRTGLPFAFLTPSLHYVTSATLQKKQPPTGLSLTKYYFRAHVEALEKQAAEVRALGQAAIEEWYKGLEVSGNLHIEDASRLENWELRQYNVNHNEQMSPTHINGSLTLTLSAATTIDSRSTVGVRSVQPSPFWSVRCPSGFEHPAASPSFSSPTWPAPSQLPQYDQGFITGQSWMQTSHSPGLPTHNHPVRSTMFVPPTPSTSSKPRLERTPHNILQLKAERRAEIERRCQSLVPPIQASTLQYMEAFNAAIQIPMVLNENAWNLLRDRLLTQRPEAEQKERDHQMSIHASTINVDERRRYEENKRAAQQTAQNLWSDISRPLRHKIKDIAGYYVQDVWNSGHLVTQATCSQFAADVLLHVRQRYYTKLEEEDVELMNHGLHLPQDQHSILSRRLKLEDMKWIFEEIVKPHTDKFGKEIFLCSTCDANQKHFSFDAVIQHYAAKHTTALSHKTAVVYWKADWPADSPFHPQPTRNFSSAVDELPSQRLVQPHASPAYLPKEVAGWPTARESGSSMVQRQSSDGIQVHDLVYETSTIWEKISSITGLCASVRFYIIIQHIASVFDHPSYRSTAFPTFVHCVKHEAQLQSLRGLTGLRCRQCTAKADGLQSAVFHPAYYSTTDLLDHFQYDHIGPSDFVVGMHPDNRQNHNNHDRWIFDMVELPDLPTIQDMIESAGLDEQGRILLTGLVPHWFPSKNMTSIYLQNDHSAQISEHYRLPLWTGSRTGIVNVRQTDRSFHRPERQASGMSHSANVDEYDPRHPSPVNTVTPQHLKADSERLSSYQRVGAFSNETIVPHGSPLPRHTKSVSYSYKHDLTNGDTKHASSGSFSGGGRNEIPTDRVYAGYGREEINPLQLTSHIDGFDSMRDTDRQYAHGERFLNELQVGEAPLPPRELDGTFGPTELRVIGSVAVGQSLAPADAYDNPRYDIPDRHEQRDYNYQSRFRSRDSDGLFEVGENFRPDHRLEYSRSNQTPDHQAAVYNFENSQRHYDEFRRTNDDRETRSRNTRLADMFHTESQPSGHHRGAVGAYRFGSNDVAANQGQLDSSQCLRPFEPEVTPVFATRRIRQPRTYVEILPSGERRMIDELGYPRGDYQPARYVQVVPPDDFGPASDFDETHRPREFVADQYEPARSYDRERSQLHADPNYGRDRRYNVLNEPHFVAERIIR